ncbi:MAG: cytochrome c3 family protein [Planctomycetota bacterium]|jgi:hypothetical protein
MYYRFFFIIFTITAIVGLILLGCNGSKSETDVNKKATCPDSTEKVSTALSPLIVDKTAPLLLDEPSETKDASSYTAGSAADNSACFVCHVNYKTEQLASQHAAWEVSCADCHGESTGHCNDEFHRTPPDIMYSKNQIDPLCQKCHIPHDTSTEKLVKHWQQQHPNKMVPKIIACTDCHGEHRLRLRTVQWDKKTRKLSSN